MLLPQDLLNIILDYYSQMMILELQGCLQQHIISMHVLDELMFAHENQTTFALEFHGMPVKVIRDLNRIRGYYEPSRTILKYAHPRVSAIMTENLVNVLEILN